MQSVAPWVNPNAYVEFDATVCLFGRAPFAVSHWFRTAYTGPPSHLGDVLGNRRAPSHGNFLSARFRGDGKFSVELDEDSFGTNYVEAALAPGAVCDSRWHHLAYVRQGCELTLYLDGAAAVTTRTESGETTDIAGVYPFRVGCSLDGWPGNYRALPFELDDLRIYSEALSPATVRSLHKLGMRSS